MALGYLLTEDRLPQKIPLIYSAKIRQKIREIMYLNQDNEDSVSKWKTYISGITSYISNRAIALDYVNRYPHFRNGATFVRDFDYNVGFKIIEDKYTKQPVIFVFMVNLKAEDYGLNVPSNKRSTIKLSETQFRNIISESIRQVLRRALYGRTLSEHRSIGRQRPNRVRNL